MWDKACLFVKIVIKIEIWKNLRRSSRDSSLILTKGDVQRRSDPLGRVTRLLWFNGEIRCFSRTQGHSSTDITPRPLTSISTATEETFVQRSRPPSASLLWLRCSCADRGHRWAFTGRLLLGFKEFKGYNHWDSASSNTVYTNTLRTFLAVIKHQSLKLHLCTAA